MPRWASGPRQSKSSNNSMCSWIPKKQVTPEIPPGPRRSYKQAVWRQIRGLHSKERAREANPLISANSARAVTIQTESGSRWRTTGHASAAAHLVAGDVVGDEPENRGECSGTAKHFGSGKLPHRRGAAAQAAAREWCGLAARGSLAACALTIGEGWLFGGTFLGRNL